MLNSRDAEENVHGAAELSLCLDSASIANLSKGSCPIVLT
jgi:hypothetical protein